MSTFPQFSSPRMPAEVRNLIFDAFIALTPSRTLPLKLHSRPYNPHGRDSTLALPDDEHPEQTPRVYFYSCPALIPAALHICAASRARAMKRWSLAFGREKPTGDWEDGDQFREMCREGKVWSNWDAGQVLYEGRRTVWVDLSGDVLEFLDVKKQKEDYSDDDDDDDQEEEINEEEVVITIREFGTCVDEAERKLVKTIQLHWSGLRNEKYWKHPREVVRFKDIAVKRAMTIIRAFEGLKVLIIRCKHTMGVFDEEDQDLVQILDMIMEDRGVRVEFRDRENMLFGLDEWSHLTRTYEE